MERHGLESVGVEWSDGAKDDEEESFVRWANPNGALSANCNMWISKNAKSRRRNNLLSVGRM